jgi:hypothetical protein
MHCSFPANHRSCFNQIQVDSGGEPFPCEFLEHHFRFKMPAVEAVSRSALTISAGNVSLIESEPESGFLGADFSGESVFADRFV